MTCPRCNNEWDVSKSPCPRCGLKVNLPFRSGVRPPLPIERVVPQTPRSATSSQLDNSPFDRPSTNSDTPRTKPTSRERQSPNSQSERRQQSGFMPSIRKQQENREAPAQLNNDGIPNTPLPQRISSFDQQQAGGQRDTRNNLRQSQPILPELNQPFDIPSNIISSTEVPRTFQPSAPNYPSPSLRSRQQNTEEDGKKTPNRASDFVNRENIVARRNVPSRPLAQPAQDRSTDNLLDPQRPIRHSHLITDALVKGEPQPLNPNIPNLPTTPHPTSIGEANVESLPTLVPGKLLRGGRYRLREPHGRQDWRDEVYEAAWIAQDAQRAGAPVMIYELGTPDSKSMVTQSMLRRATMALTSIGRHQHIPTLWDAFSDQGRSFFVFEPIEGESLMGYMRRTGRALPEQDVIECCIQMTEILELLSQQSPPLVHGLIRPEHIVMGRMGVDYTLTNFSIVLAGGATQYVTDVDRASLTPYTAPEFGRGTVDGRSDIFALLATAYHAVTGSMPIYSGGNISQPQRLNPAISPEFDAIFAKGLRPNPAQRYQRPTELRQDLLAMRSVAGSLSSRSGPLTMPEAANSERPSYAPVARKAPSFTIPNDGSLSQVLPSLMEDAMIDQEQQVLLPRPEDLPPMPERNDVRLAMLWLVGILLCLLVVVIVSRGIF